MSWFRIDDTFWSHRKARKAGVEACGLWAACGSYASSDACDDTGLLTADDVEMVANVLGAKSWKKLADRLLDAGLWEAHPQGYLFHNWDKYRQGGEAELARRKEKDAERKRRKREERDKSRDVSAECPRTDSGQIQGQSEDVSAEPVRTSRSSRPDLPVPSFPPTPTEISTCLVDDPAGMVQGTWLSTVAKTSGKPQSRLSIRDVKTLHAICEAHAPAKRGQELLAWVAAFAAEFAKHADGEGLNFGGFGLDRARKWIDSGKPEVRKSGRESLLQGADKDLGYEETA